MPRKLVAKPHEGAYLLQIGDVPSPGRLQSLWYLFLELTVSEYKFCTNQALGPSYYVNLYCATLKRND